MRLPKLPAPGPRKEALLALTPAVDLAAEIGADHGIISAHLLASGVCGRMIVSDISAASLEKARRLFALHGLSSRALFRVADGLSAVDEPVGAVILAGIGGGTMADILERGMARAGEAELILQPATGLPRLRRFLMEAGFAIAGERLAWESGRFYVALRARRGAAVYEEKALLLGPCLLRERPPLFDDYLRWRRACLLRERRVGADQAVAWLEEELRRAAPEGTGAP